MTYTNEYRDLYAPDPGGPPPTGGLGWGLAPWGLFPWGLGGSGTGGQGEYCDLYSDLYGICPGTTLPPPPPGGTPAQLETEAKAQVRTSHMMIATLELFNVVNGKEKIVAATYATPTLRLLPGGNVRAQRQSETSRTISCSLADPDGTLTPDEDHHMVDPLSRPVIKVRRGVRYRSRLTGKFIDRTWPLGTFVVEGCNVEENDAGVATLSISGSSRNVLVSANAWDEPYDIIGGPKYHEAIKAIIEDRAGTRFTPRFNFEVSDHEVPDVTFDPQSDPWQECQKLAEADGKELLINADDVFVLRSIPDPRKLSPVWTLDEGDNLGLLPGKNRNVNIQNAFNGVRCVGSAPWLLYDVRATAWDDDPGSITYYLGTFGKKLKEIQDAMVANADQALLAAQKELLNVLGVMEDVQFNALPAPFLSEGDVIRMSSDNIRVSATAMLETIEMPLDPEGSMAATIRRQRNG